MTYAARLQKELKKELPGRVVYFKDWKKIRRVRWRAAKARPSALMLHHTAAAATESTDPRAKGNQKGANNGVINYIQTHFKVPAANFTLDRDGTVYVHSAYPVWHAGVGSFRGKEPWDRLGIPDDAANDYVLGVEIMSKGRKKDFTKAQKDSLGALIRACAEASDTWLPVWLVGRPRHKDWTTRKIDILYTNDEVKKWIKP